MGLMPRVLQENKSYALIPCKKILRKKNNLYCSFEYGTYIYMSIRHLCRVKVYSSLQDIYAI